MSTSQEKKMLTLRSSNNEDFLVEESVAIQSITITIKNIVDDDCASTLIPLRNVNSLTLAKVIEFLEKHADLTVSEEDMKAFDTEFVKIKPSELNDLILAADYLNINNLMDISCQACADNIEEMSVEEAREIFNIENDYTPEEEAQLPKKNEWAFA